MSDAPGGKVAVLARIPAQPGKRDALVEALQEAIDNANTEAGTLLYILHTDPKDPDAVRLIEDLTTRYRRAIGRLGDVVPPDRYRALHLQTLAEGREAADRLDVAAQRARADDFDAATQAVSDLGGLIPTLPEDVLSRTPSCRSGVAPKG